MHRTVTLIFNGIDIKPNPDPIPVNDNDTLSFELEGAPPGSTFVISMNPEFFNPCRVTSSDSKTTVTQAAETPYQCEVRDAANESLLWSGQLRGGHTRPEKPVRNS